MCAEDDKYGNVKRELCASIGAQYVVRPSFDDVPRFSFASFDHNNVLYILATVYFDLNAWEQYKDINIALQTIQLLNSQLCKTERSGLVQWNSGANFLYCEYPGMKNQWIAGCPFRVYSMRVFQREYVLAPMCGGVCASNRAVSTYRVWAFSSSCIPLHLLVFTSCTSQSQTLLCLIMFTSHWQSNAWYERVRHSLKSTCLIVSATHWKAHASSYPPLTEKHMPHRVRHSLKSICLIVSATHWKAYASSYPPLTEKHMPHRVRHSLKSICLIVSTTHWKAYASSCPPVTDNHMPRYVC